MTDNDRKAVDKLLEMYKNYTAINREREIIASRLAKAKLLGEPTPALSKKYAELQVGAQQVSEAMTYSSPIVWMMYKYEAYANEAQPIRTLRDFRVHCSKPGYICTKRFNFMNAQLDTRGLPNLRDEEHYPDALLLSEAVVSAGIMELVKDRLFQELWVAYEYHKDEGRVAKWENYQLGS